MIIKLVSSDTDTYLFDVVDAGSIVRASVNSGIRYGDVFELETHSGQHFETVWLGGTGISGYLVGDVEKSIRSSELFISESKTVYKMPQTAQSIVRFVKENTEDTYSQYYPEIVPLGWVSGESHDEYSLLQFELYAPAALCGTSLRLDLMLCWRDNIAELGLILDHEAEAYTVSDFLLGDCNDSLCDMFLAHLANDSGAAVREFCDSYPAIKDAMLEALYRIQAYMASVTTPSGDTTPAKISLEEGA